MALVHPLAPLLPSLLPGFPTTFFLSPLGAGTSNERPQVFPPFLFSCAQRRNPKLSYLYLDRPPRTEHRRTIPAMAARCALSAPSCLVRKPLCGDKLGKKLTPCLPSPRAVKLRANAAKLPSGVSVKEAKNASGYYRRKVVRKVFTAQAPVQFLLHSG